MKLSNNDIQELCDLAISAANQAGAIISAYTNKELTVKSKIGGDSLASQVVTEVDQLSQDKVIEVLTPGIEKFDLGLLAEETEDDKSRLVKDYFWCIDPLDGTLPFIKSRAGYSVSIALVSKTGESIIGVIYDPLKNTLYHAFKNGGAFVNHHPLEKNEISDVFTFINDESFKEHPQYNMTIEVMEKIASNLGYNKFRTIFLGGAAMNTMWVLEKNPACYFKIPRKTNGGGSLWDYAASACILDEAGAIASDMKGNVLDLNREESTHLNHQGVLYTNNQVLSDKIIEAFN